MIFPPIAVFTLSRYSSSYIISPPPAVFTLNFTHRKSTHTQLGEEIAKRFKRC